MIGLVYVIGSGPLLMRDLPKSFHYAPGLHAWLLVHPIRFVHPISLPDLGITGGQMPQNFRYVDGKILRTLKRRS